MSLRYRYVLAQAAQPVLPLGGRWVRPRPLVHITLLGPTGTAIELAKLDTGADDTIFPETVAAQIGVDLSNAPSGTAIGIGSGPVPLRYAEVTLRLTSGQERRQWQGWIGFTPAPLIRPLLGFAGCLQFFKAVFHGDLEEVELTPNRLYTGT